MNLEQIILIMVIGIAILLVGWFLFARVLRNKKRPEVSFVDLNFDIEALIHACGDIKNMQSVEATTSKLSIVVENIEVVDAAKIKALGASGIVMTSNKVTVIFGKISETIAVYLNQQISR